MHASNPGSPILKSSSIEVREEYFTGLKIELGRGAGGIAYLCEYKNDVNREENDRIKNLCLTVKDENGEEHYFVVLKEPLPGSTINNITEEQIVSNLLFDHLTDPPREASDPPARYALSHSATYIKNNGESIETVISKPEVLYATYNTKENPPISYFSSNLLTMFKNFEANRGKEKDLKLPDKITETLTTNFPLIIAQLMHSMHDSLLSVHSKHVLHLDLALRNILLSTIKFNNDIDKIPLEFTSVLSDWGFSKIATDGPVKLNAKDVPLKWVNQAWVRDNMATEKADYYAARIAMFEAAAGMLGNIQGYFKKIVKAPNGSDPISVAVFVRDYGDDHALATYFNNVTQEAHNHPEVQRFLDCYKDYLCPNIKNPKVSLTNITRAQEKALFTECSNRYFKESLVAALESENASTVLAGWNIDQADDVEKVKAFLITIHMLKKLASPALKPCQELAKIPLDSESIKANKKIIDQNIATLKQLTIYERQTQLLKEAQLAIDSYNEDLRKAKSLLLLDPSEHLISDFNDLKTTDFHSQKLISIRKRLDQTFVKNIQDKKSYLTIAKQIDELIQQLDNNNQANDINLVWAQLENRRKEIIRVHTRKADDDQEYLHNELKLNISIFESTKDNVKKDNLIAVADLLKTMFTIQTLMQELKIEEVIADGHKTLREEFQEIAKWKDENPALIPIIEAYAKLWGFEVILDNNNVNNNNAEHPPRSEYNHRSEYNRRSVSFEDHETIYSKMRQKSQIFGKPHPAIAFADAIKVIKMPLTKENIELTLNLANEITAISDPHLVQLVFENLSNLSLNLAVFLQAKETYLKQFPAAEKAEFKLNEILATAVLYGMEPSEVDKYISENNDFQNYFAEINDKINKLSIAAAKNPIAKKTNGLFGFWNSQVTANSSESTKPLLVLEDDKKDALDNVYYIENKFIADMQTLLNTFIDDQGNIKRKDLQPNDKILLEYFLMPYKVFAKCPIQTKSTNDAEALLHISHVFANRDNAYLQAIRDVNSHLPGFIDFLESLGIKEETELLRLPSKQLQLTNDALKRLNDVNNPAMSALVKLSNYSIEQLSKSADANKSQAINKITTTANPTEKNKLLFAQISPRIHVELNKKIEAATKALQQHLEQLHDKANIDVKQVMTAVKNLASYAIHLPSNKMDITNKILEILTGLCDNKDKEALLAYLEEKLGPHEEPTLAIHLHRLQTAFEQATISIAETLKIQLNGLNAQHICNIPIFQQLQTILLSPGVINELRNPEQNNLVDSYAQTYKMSVAAVAETLIANDRVLFDKIDSSEFLKDSYGKTLDDAIKFQQQVTMYIMQDILNKKHLADRALAMEFWINVADQCLNNSELKSQNMAVAITTALRSPSIHSLAVTKKSLSKYAQEKLIDINIQTDVHQRDFVNLKFYRSKHPDAIPYLGLYGIEFITLKHQHQQIAKPKDENTGEQPIEAIFPFEQFAPAYKLQQEFHQRQKLVRAADVINFHKLNPLTEAITAVDLKLASEIAITTSKTIGLTEGKLSPSTLPQQASQIAYSKMLEKPKQPPKQQNPATERTSASPLIFALGVDFEKYSNFNTDCIKLGQQSGSTLDTNYAESILANDPSTLNEPSLNKAIALTLLMVKNADRFKTLPKAAPKELQIKNNNNLTFAKNIINELKDADLADFLNWMKIKDNDQSLLEQLPEEMRKYIEAVEKFIVEFDHYPSKQELSQALPKDMSLYEMVSNKPGGRNGAGPYGAVYKFTYIVREQNKIPEYKEQLLLFKSDTTPDGETHNDKNIAEFVAGRIMNAVADGGDVLMNAGTGGSDSIATLIFATRPTDNGASTPIQTPDADGKNVYIGSIYLDGFREIFKLMGYDERTKLFESRHKQEYVNILGTNVNGTIVSNFEDFEKIFGASLLVGDFDFHAGNIGGAVIDPDSNRHPAELPHRKKWRAKKIDHAGGLEALEDDLHPLSRSRHRAIRILSKKHPIETQPTNHFLDFPRDLIINQACADVLEAQAQVDLTDVISNAIDEVAKYYGPKPIAEFATRMGMDMQKVYTDLALQPDNQDSIKAKLVNNIKSFLTHKMKMRQQSIHQFAMEIKTSNALENQDGEYMINDSIKNAIMSDPYYYLKGEYHFRKDWQADINFTLGPYHFRKDLYHFKPTHNALKDLVNEALYEQMADIIEQAETQLTPRIIEYIFANEKLCEQYPEEELDELKNKYQNILTKLAATLDSKKVSQQVITEILSESSLAHRTLALKRWIAIMDICNKHRKKEVAIAIHQAFYSPEILRLSSTFAGLSSKEHIIINNMNQPNILPEIKTDDDVKGVSSLRSESLEPKGMKLTPAVIKNPPLKVKSSPKIIAPTGELKAIIEELGTIIKQLREVQTELREISTNIYATKPGSLFGLHATTTTNPAITTTPVITK